MDSEVELKRKNENLERELRLIKSQSEEALVPFQGFHFSFSAPLHYP